MIGHDPLTIAIILLTGAQKATKKVANTDATQRA